MLTVIHYIFYILYSIFYIIYYILYSISRLPFQALSDAFNFAAAILYVIRRLLHWYRACFSRCGLHLQTQLHASTYPSWAVQILTGFVDPSSFENC